MNASEKSPPAWVASDFALFDVSVAEVDDVGDVRVRVVGELDVLTAPALVEALSCLCGSAADRLAAPHRGAVHLDLSGLSFMDTAGVRAIAECRASLVAAGWRVCPTAAQPQVLRILEHSENQGWLPHDFVCADVPLRSDSPERRS